MRTQPNGPLSTNDTDNPVHTPRLTTMVVTGYEGLKVVTEPFLHDSNLTKYGIQRSIEGFWETLVSRKGLSSPQNIK